MLSVTQTRQYWPWRMRSVAGTSQWPAGTPPAGWSRPARSDPALTQCPSRRRPRTPPLSGWRGDSSGSSGNWWISSGGTEPRDSCSCPRWSCCHICWPPPTLSETEAFADPWPRKPDLFPENWIFSYFVYVVHKFDHIQSGNILGITLLLTDLSGNFKLTLKGKSSFNFALSISVLFLNDWLIPWWSNSYFGGTFSFGSFICYKNFIAITSITVINLSDKKDSSWWQAGWHVRSSSKSSSYLFLWPFKQEFSCSFRN